MDAVKNKFQHIAILSHPDIPNGKETAGEIAALLADRGIQSTQGMLIDEAIQQSLRDGRFDLVITLGGDGTVLRAGHLCGPLDIPILAVNLGHFGFLIEVTPKNIESALDKLLSGAYWIEERMMLQACLWRGEESLKSWEVVNEVVVSRGQIARPVHLAALLDGDELAAYVTDALIVATPTGSTAYAMAAGGPVLPPQLRNILIVPVAPHLSLDRALVLSEGAEVSIEVLSSHQAIASVDGQAPVDLENGDRVTVNASQHILRFVRFQEPDYFYRNLVSLMAKNPAIGER